MPRQLSFHAQLIAPETEDARLDRLQLLSEAPMKMDTAHRRHRWKPAVAPAGPVVAAAGILPREWTLPAD
jgi:hypothetical protein